MRGRRHSALGQTLWVCVQSDGTEQETFSVGKQIAAYLSTVSSQHTMDHLMYEISQLLHESDDPSMSKNLAERAGKVSEQALLRLYGSAFRAMKYNN